jgi:hypothetical protein
MAGIESISIRTILVIFLTFPNLGDDCLYYISRPAMIKFQAVGLNIRNLFSHNY